MAFLGIDAGTTRCKGVLFSENGSILASESRDNSLIIRGGETYVNLELIRENVRSIIKEISRKHRIDTVTITSLGESFVALDDRDEMIFPPMLYSDLRGNEQAEAIARSMPPETVFSLSGVMPHGMYSLYKLLWWKQNRPEEYKKIRKILLVGDYLGYYLTGNAIIDRSLAARTGALNIENMTFSEELLSFADLTPDRFSAVAPTGTVIGQIRPSLARELGVNPECIVVSGSHDQICSAIGSGVCREGVGVDGMGTVECITAVFARRITDPEMGKKGYPCVPFVRDGIYATYILNYTCGALMNWFVSDLMRNSPPGNYASVYEWCEDGLDPSHASDLLLLPYFRGAATPYNDVLAKGAILGLGCDTSPADIYRAILEGTSYEMRLNLEAAQSFGIGIRELVATGGCAKSDAWLQIKSNILGIPITRVSNVESGCRGAAMLGAVSAGIFESLDRAAEVFVGQGETFRPCGDGSFDRQYEKYKKMYASVKEVLS